MSLIVDAAASEQRSGMFFIDCNDRSGSSHRYWISRGELKEGAPKTPATPVDEGAAMNICNTELKSRTANPSTYDPALLTGSISAVVERVGRNVVEIDFSAANAFGVEGKYRGRCILESGNFIEVTIEER
jgi:hypothetical protein